MMNITKLRFWCGLVALLGVVLPMRAQVGNTALLGSGAESKTRWDLLADKSSLEPGRTNTVALRMHVATGWHTYWRQPSDSGEIGQAPSVQWTLPEGVRIGDLSWPTPEAKYEAALRDTAYVYHDEVWLLAPVIVGREVAPGPITIRGEIKWQECDADHCFPRRAQISLASVVGPTASVTPELIAEFAAAKARLPMTADFSVDLKWLDPASSASRRFAVEFDRSPGHWNFFPHDNPLIALGDSDPSLVKDLGGRIQVVKQATKTGADWPTTVRGVVVDLDDRGRALAAWEAEARGRADGLVMAAPSVAAIVKASPGSVATAATPESSVPAAPVASFWAMLGAAFLGGLILNVMPCVLPVIALKILGFVRQSQESPARVRVLGLAYGAGVLISFVGLALMIIIAQAMRGWASWGMQFQDARFLVLMTTLVTLVSLNLFGVFEIHLGSRTMTAASGLAQREGIGGALANGILATVLATPCTAPFLAPALGYAIPQKSAAIILLFFLAIGLGLATPYVILCWNPRWLKLLPKPGAWMEKFKMAMGFPMLATAVWLFTLTVAHFGEDGILWMGIFLVMMSLAAWIYGDFVQRAHRRPVLGWIAFGVVVGSSYFFILEGRLEWRVPNVPSGAAVVDSTRNRGSHLPWEKWSPSAVSAARAAGRPVLVDFTAKSCLICQLNKKIAIEVPAVAEKIRTNDVAILKGDFTMEDPQILEELQRYGRSGVPLVLVYSRDPKAPPQVLPASLSKGMVLDALEQAIR